MVDISVIIPVFNAQEHLARCLNSVLAQDFSNYEIILVDDGSKDNSLKICKEFESQISKIHVFSKNNGGANSARAFGVEQSKGTYISFVDSDDKIPPSSLSNLYEKAVKNRLDIVQASTTFCTEENHIKWSKLLREGIYNSKDFIKFLFLDQCDGGPHGNLYHHSLFSKETFNLPFDVRLGEDFYMNLCLGIQANKIGLFNDISCYCYYENPKSVTHTYNFDSIVPHQHQLECIRTVLKNHNLFKDFAKIFYQKAIYTLSSICLHNHDLIRNTYIQEIVQEAEEYQYSLKFWILLKMLKYPFLYPLFFSINKVRKFFNKK